MFSGYFEPLVARTLLSGIIGNIGFVEVPYVACRHIFQFNTQMFNILSENSLINGSSTSLNVSCKPHSKFRVPFGKTQDPLITWTVVLKCGHFSSLSGEVRFTTIRSSKGVTGNPNSLSCMIHRTKSASSSSVKI